MPNKKNRVKEEKDPSVTNIKGDSTEVFVPGVTREASTFELKQGVAEVSPGLPGFEIKRLMSLLAGKYRFEEFLGLGGFAVVYKVTNLALGRTEALKILLDTQHSQPDFAERFTQEARVSASLDHPNIIRVYEFGQQERVFWFSMQYIEGPTLAAELKVRSILSEIEAAGLILPLLDALEYSHNRGVIHRDIKPGNIMLDMHGKPYLMDFGIAKSMGSLLKTQTGHFLGTPVYVAPEQASGQPIDSRVDLYAMGVTLYELLSGKFPFPADSPVQSLVSRLTSDPIPLSTYRTGIDPKLEFITMRALEKDPSKRFHSAREMHGHLSRFVGQEQVTQPFEITIQSQTPSPDSAGISYPGQGYEYATAVTQLDSQDLLPQQKRLPKILGAVVLAVIVVIFAVTGLVLKDTGDDSPVTKTIETPEKDTIKSVITKPQLQKEQETVTRTPLSTPEPGGKKKNTPQKSMTISQPKAAKKETAPPRRLPSRPVMPPQVEKEVQPVFPTTLSKQCVGQIINLSLVIGIDGKVVKSRIISTGHPSQCAEALAAVKEAVMKYTFKPALDDEDKPVKTTIAIAVQI
ncbi:MAG: protein kinase [bacterium]|nr:protein kinase [bacterium]